jgi:hypothetical protein
LPIDPVLNVLILAHSVISYLSILILSSYSHVGLISGLLFGGLPTEMQHIILIYPVVLLLLNLYIGECSWIGPLGTAAINRPTVPASDDYDDGEIGGI